MNRGRISTGGFVPIVALLLVLTVLVAGQPFMNEDEMKNIAYQQGRVVTNVQGYMELAKNNHTFALDFTEVTQVVSDRDPDKRYLQLSGEQFFLQIEYVYQNEGQSSGHYQFGNLIMLVRNKRRGGAYMQVCFFDQKFSFVLPENSRYSCNKEQTHRCSRNGELVANVVLTTFELELDGNPEKVKELQFSKPAWPESCEHWSK